MKILFATDGSDHSDNALETILAQPWPDGSECRIVTVAAPFKSNPILGGIAAMAAQAEAALMDDLKKMLAEANDKLAEKFGKTKVTSVIREGSPAATIIELATNWPADLIVMGSHGTSGYNDDQHGSVAILVMNHAPCSVQIVHYITSASQEKKDARHLPVEEARFLLAINDSPNSKAVVDTVLSRPWPKESLFQVLSIVPELKSVFHSRFFKDPQIDQAHQKIYAAQKEHLVKLTKEIAAKLGSKFGTDKVTHHVLEGNVRSLILQIAQDWPADVIIIGAHDRDKSIFEHFLGSVARAVVENADCSVEIVRSPA
jgi:nucleotide-binding universal stress UspA family protein